MKKNSGFTLIELLVVVAIIALIAGFIIVGLSDARKKARDARRMQDLNTIKTALETYRNTYQRLPRGSSLPATYVDFSYPTDPTKENGYIFLGELIQKKIIKSEIVDPINSVDDGYYYAYHFYPENDKMTIACGGKAYGLLAISKFETPREDHGFARCPYVNDPLDESTDYLDWANNKVHSVYIDYIPGVYGGDYSLYHDYSQGYSYMIFD